METKLISVEQTHPLRNLVLRPGQPRSACHYQDDELTDSFHLGAFDGDDIVGIVSLYRKPHEVIACECSNVDKQAMFQLRGMATHPDYRGRGIGNALIAHGEREVASNNAKLIWCNARIEALKFYIRNGYQAIGDEFMVEGIGPHYLMFKILD